MKNKERISNVFDYDIIIVGGGPSGSTFARLIANKAKVLLIDKKTNDNTSFKKVCGGLLSEDAQKTLAKYNIAIPKTIIADPQIFSVKVIDLKKKVVQNYQRFYLNLDRHKFDMWLLSLIPNFVNRITNNVTSIERLETGFKVHCNDKTYTTKYIVGADGANSIVRRTFFPKKKIRSYVALQQWFESNESNPYYSCIFDPDTSDCCSWTISKDGYCVYGGAFNKKNCRKNFEKQTTNLETFGLKFGKPLKTEACLVLRPKLFSDYFCGGKGVFLIGEAAGFISPSSLEGFSYAFQSAEALEKSFNNKNINRKYKKNTFKMRLKLFTKNIKSLFIYCPILRYLIMKSKMKSIEVLERE